MSPSPEDRGPATPATPANPATPATQASSTPTAPAPAAPAPRDGGFSLVEILVCLALLSIIAGSVVPQMITGIRSNGSAEIHTQAKGIALAQTERMRNLPFYVAPDAGDYIDLLDTYFRNVTPPGTTPACGSSGRWTVPSTTWQGYVGPSAARCAWEPPAPFYRHVRSEGDFMVVTDTRFLTDATPPSVITPATTYNSQDRATVANAEPPASQLAVHVAVFPKRFPIDEPVRTATQLGRTETAAARVLGRVDISAVQLGTTNVDGLPVSLSGGLTSLAGSLTTTSNTSANLTGALSGIGTGAQGGGASSSAASPPDTSNPATTAPGGSLSPGCVLVCWGGTRVSALSSTSSSGLPNIGSPTSPVTTSLDSSSNKGLSLRGGLGAVYPLDLELDPTQPLVRLDTGAAVTDSIQPTCALNLTTGTPDRRVVAGGWLTSSGGLTGADKVEACAVARSAPVSVLPTTFAPEGVVRISMDYAAARCTVAGPSHNATTSVDYLATVEAWSPTGYRVVATVRPSNSNDPLATVAPASISLGARGTLAKYIASWSTATRSQVTQSSSGGTAAIEVPGLVNLVTQPLRAGATSTPTPTPSPTSTPTPTPTTTGTPTTTSTPTATATATPSPTPTSTPTPSLTATAGTSSPSASLTATAGTSTPRPTTTASPTPTDTATASPTTATPTTTASPTSTGTPTASTAPTTKPGPLFVRGPQAAAASSAAEAASAVTVSVGALSCTAMDAR